MKQLVTLLIATIAWVSSAGGASFEENKGQVRTTDGAAAPFVRYHLADGSTHIFLLNDGIAYQFQRTHMPDGLAEMMKRAYADPGLFDELKSLQEHVRVETYRMDMRLEGADPLARISTSGRSNDYVNYYNRDALDVHSYERVTYHDVYPGIDWVVYTHGAGIKYDFVVHPGADPDLIRMVFEYQEELQVDAQGKLLHGNRMGRFTEDAPVSFQDGRTVGTHYVLEGNELRYALGAYDRTRALTIDPERIWGTYYGGEDYDDAFGTAVDGNGNVYLAGSTFSTMAIAAGGHQVIYGGSDFDAYVAKFNSDGMRLWATYYGGTQSDLGNSCAVDAAGNVFLAGATRSLNAIHSDGFQSTMAGGFSIGDAFLVKFNPDGTRMWGTYYGGINEDAAFDCATDADGNVYLAGWTWSNTGIASGGHQNALDGDSEQDAFLVKFDGDGGRLWATYYGGDGDETGWACAVDADNNVYLGGTTDSNEAIADGGHQNTLTDDDDGFLVKFNSSGVRLWGTYYGGVFDDHVRSCAVDGDGNVYIAGGTESSDGIASAGHQNDFADGDSDTFLAKFNAAGVRQWGTYYGGEEYEEAGFCATDGSGNVYLAGTTESASNIAAGGPQNTSGGGTDGFVAKFDGNGMRLWGTFYGGPNTDYGNACATDADGHVYLAGTTTSSVGIAMDGHQNEKGNFDDGYLTKFDGTVSTGIPANTTGNNELQWHGQQGTIHQFDLGGSRPTGLALWDAAGHLVQQVAVPASNGRLTIDLAGLAPGMYVLQAVLPSGVAAVRMVHE